MPDDLSLSEIQDYLTIAGYDVPLRSYVTIPVGAPQAPPLDLRAVEALRCERTGHPPGTDTMMLGTCCPCASCRSFFALVEPLLAHARALRGLVDEAERILGQRALWYDKATDTKVCDFCGGSWEPGPDVRDAEHQPRCPYADWRKRAAAVLAAAQDGPA